MHLLRFNLKTFYIDSEVHVFDSDKCLTNLRTDLNPEIVCSSDELFFGRPL